MRRGSIARESVPRQTSSLCMSNPVLSVRGIGSTRTARSLPEIGIGIQMDVGRNRAFALRTGRTVARHPKAANPIHWHTPEQSACAIYSLQESDFHTFVPDRIVMHCSIAGSSARTDTGHEKSGGKTILTMHLPHRVKPGAAAEPSRRLPRHLAFERPSGSCLSMTVAVAAKVLLLYAEQRGGNHGGRIHVPRPSMPEQTP